jgi:hypothetical protein
MFFSSYLVPWLFLNVRDALALGVKLCHKAIPRLVIPKCRHAHVFSVKLCKVVMKYGCPSLATLY